MTLALKITVRKINKQSELTNLHYVDNNLSITLALKITLRNKINK